MTRTLRVLGLVALLTSLSRTAAWAACGDGVVDGGEECDQGGQNGSSTSCCTTLCEFRAVNTTCRPAPGGCDIAETCSGTSATCPPDMVRAANVICRPAIGGCDKVETCNGTDPTCPSDDLQPAGFECRDEAGPCDVAENCSGSDPNCPTDAVKDAGTVCNVAVGDCDQAETCDGSTTGCPPDELKPADTVCRPAAGSCDAAEVCTGVSTACPPDVFLPNTTPCNDGSACTSGDTCFQGVCVGTSELDACLDDFICYRTTFPRFTPILGVQLDDAFENGPFTVARPKHLCVPADKNQEGIVDAVTHLRSYTIRPAPGSPRHVPHTNILVQNQLGFLRVDTTRADLLMVPTAKSLTGPVPPPDPQTHNVDHYKCYRVRLTTGTARFPKSVTVTATDQFGTSLRTIRLKKPRHLCNPVDKNGEGIKNPTGHLMCYLARGTPRPARANGVNTSNQFGSEVISRGGEQEFCIPSETTP